MLNELLVASDSGIVSVLTLLHISAAFGTTDYHILPDHLQNYMYFGISSFVLNCFQSCLSNCQHIVSIRGVQSDPATLQFGVPQGSVLGSFFFCSSSFLFCLYYIFNHSLRYYESPQGSAIVSW